MAAVEPELTNEVKNDGIESVDDVQEKIEIKQAVMNSYETLLEKDRSLSTILEIFYELLHNPNFDNMCKFIQGLGQSVKEMFAYIPDLRSFAGKEKIDTLHALIDEFSQLLVMTKQTLTNVVQQANIQQISLEDMIENINNIPKNKFDKTEFEDSICTLSQWMSDSAITNAIDKWTAFCTKCQKQHSTWQDLINNAKTNRKNTAVKVTQIFGGILLAGGLIAAFLAGGAALGVGGMALKLGVTGKAIACIGSTCVSQSFITTVLVSGILSAAAGGIILGVGLHLDDNTQAIAYKVFQQAIVIRQSLKEMLLFGGKMKKDLNDLNIHKNDNIGPWVTQLNDRKSRKRILTASDNIVNYLKEYQIEGKKIIKNVSDAQNEILQTIRASAQL